MKVVYDPRTDILTLRFKPGLVAKSGESKAGVILDFDEVGDLLGLDWTTEEWQAGKEAGATGATQEHRLPGSRCHPEDSRFNLSRRHFHESDLRGGPHFLRSIVAGHLQMLQEGRIEVAEFAEVFDAASLHGGARVGFRRVEEYGLHRVARTVPPLGETLGRHHAVRRSQGIAQSRGLRLNLGR